MRRRTVGLLPLLLLSVSGQATAADAGQSLNGLWQGDDLELAVVAQLGLGSTEPDKLDRWQPFHVLDAQSSMIFFSIGRDRYVGLLLSSNSLSLTRLGDAHSAYTLHRRQAQVRKE